MNFCNGNGSNYLSFERYVLNPMQSFAISVHVLAI